jgi:hypothetical protein
VQGSMNSMAVSNTLSTSGSHTIAMMHTGTSPIQNSGTGSNTPNGAAISGNSAGQSQSGTVGVAHSGSSASSHGSNSLQHMMQPAVPLSPYGNWSTSFAAGMAGAMNGTNLYSPAALRSPANGGAIFSKAFQ